MQIFTLASGSGGNCTLVREGETAVLIDAGISLRRISTSLAELGLLMDDLSGILITHEHNDHICGLKTLVKHHDIPIFAPRTVANHLRYSVAGVEDFITELIPGQEGSVGGFSVLPFHTPHDTPESVGYRISGRQIFASCTDCGHITDEMLEGLSGADIALIEANHDIEMLCAGSYPPQLKRRILSDFGHLSNKLSGELAVKLYESGTHQLILAHLSHENNDPYIARRTVLAALSQEGISETAVSVAVAPEKEILQITSKETSIC
ncbi:MAG: MBL fold metallo-hydrolase [Oscillospiraceae bacterium]